MTELQKLRDLLAKEALEAGVTNYTEMARATLEAGYRLPVVLSKDAPKGSGISVEIEYSNHSIMIRATHSTEGEK